ncbi:hypothetical protein CVT25_002551 [Psilocybe cyanescens]|uniref:Uncharacterized protein n=1 Tax=Psilocybe cyanescens TaxID=93625 RepID=A0A409XWG8_PSICY|nr:hypothetical protein CVT25_002551 [Psilocybe cyanescens]
MGGAIDIAIGAYLELAQRGLGPAQTVEISEPDFHGGKRLHQRLLPQQPAPPQPR